MGPDDKATNNASFRMANASFLYCAFSVAQHNESNESRGGRKLDRFGFPIGKKTSIENRDMDQWRRERTGVYTVYLIAIVIPLSELESSFYHHIVSSFCDIHRITDGWRRGERQSHREGRIPCNHNSVTASGSFMQH